MINTNMGKNAKKGNKKQTNSAKNSINCRVTETAENPNTKKKEKNPKSASTQRSIFY